MTTRSSERRGGDCWGLAQLHVVPAFIKSLVELMVEKSLPILNKLAIMMKAMTREENGELFPYMRVKALGPGEASSACGKH